MLPLETGNRGVSQNIGYPVQLWTNTELIGCQCTDPLLLTVLGSCFLNAPQQFAGLGLGLKGLELLGAFIKQDPSIGDTCSLGVPLYPITVMLRGVPYSEH